MSSKEGINSNIQCPVDKCGRRFEDEEKMITHIQRRHPEYEGAQQSKQIQNNSAENPPQIQNINPMRKRSSSRDTQSQNQQQPVIIKKEKNVSQSKERNDSISSSSSISQQISTERSLSKEVTSSRLQQRPPTPKSSIGIKSQMGQSESMRRSQDLFRKTIENNQLIEKTVQSSSKEPVQRQQSGISSTKSQSQSITLKPSKPQLKQSTSSTRVDAKSPADNKSSDKEGNIKRQQSNVDQELIQSILLTISKADNKEAAKNSKPIESGLPNEEVQSEEEADGEEGIKQSSSKGTSRPSTANQQISSSELLKKSSQNDLTQQNGSGNLSIQNEVKKQKQVSIQEILSCKKKICCEYLLENSQNETDDIAFIETLTLNEQDLIVFEDGLTDVKFDLMISLQFLSLSKNQLINIVSLSKFSASLLELNINFNQISDINPLFECIHLEKLWASHNLITSITCLKKLKNLKVLSLFNNQISTYIDTLKELQNLEELDLADNPCSRDQYYKYDILSTIKSGKLTKLDSASITQQDIQISKTFSNNKNTNLSSASNRPGSAPLKINPRTGLSASMIVNQQIKEKENQKSKELKDKIRDNNKEKNIVSNEEYQKTQKIQELEKKLSEIQNRQLELKDQIRQTKKINKSLGSEIEEKEKENIMLREQNGQIDKIRQSNKSLMKKISAYESTIVLHTETPEELRNYIRALQNQVETLESKNSQLNQENQKLEQDFMNEEDNDDYDSDNSDYNPEKINELLRRSTAAFSQIKQDLKVLNKSQK